MDLKKSCLRYLRTDKLNAPTYLPNMKKFPLRITIIFILSQVLKISH